MILIALAMVAYIGALLCLGALLIGCGWEKHDDDFDGD